ncbi:MAG: 4-hydroxythreonine-4-phosphate dehydrogenase PdxA [bacterium]|nr:4-hydroxythreonine-4-phosphate dehydrogenase PdxA [bacterium]
MAKIAITMGDAAGIGPEIIIKALNKLDDISDLLLIGNMEIFEKYERTLGQKISKDIDVIDIPFDVSKIETGIESKYSGELAYQCLKKACDLINNNEVFSVVTAPLSKNALHLAGYNYSGQTEILQDELSDGSSKAQMLFVAEQLKVLLLTRHIPLKDVPKSITFENISEAANIFNNELKSKFGIFSPQIAMCALNPHAGESGILGSEELEIINPAIKLLRDSGVEISGAFSADTLLGKAVKEYKNPDFDGYIACYHDQALCAIKSLGLENVLNVTIGLKALRVSPSHGTAFDIAGKNKADFRSMLNAVRFLQSL